MIFYFNFFLWSFALMKVDCGQQVYDTHYQYLSNFVVTQLSDGSFFYNHPTSDLNVNQIILIQKNFFSLLAKLVDTAQSCDQVFYKFNVQIDGWQVIYPDGVTPTKAYCKNSLLIDGNKNL